jgi:hypothetical protein
MGAMNYMPVNKLTNGEIRLSQLNLRANININSLTNLIYKATQGLCIIGPFGDINFAEN